MIPWQIYCDYLEDKGVDCRLLRTVDPNIGHDIYYTVKPGRVMNTFIPEDLATGNYIGFGSPANGDGPSYGNFMRGNGLGTTGDHYGDGGSRGHAAGR